MYCLRYSPLRCPRKRNSSNPEVHLFENLKADDTEIRFDQVRCDLPSHRNLNTKLIMGKRQKLWAANKRQALIKSFGGACELCGELINLTFDTINPLKKRSHRRMDASARMSFYNEQHRRNNLQLLCRSCNARKNARPSR